MATVTSSKRHLLVTSDTYTSNGDVVVGGDLTVSGSTTTLDTQNLIVEDKNIIIGQVSTPTDTTADGGGITLKGASDYTIAWNDSRNAWLFNQHLQPSSDFSHDLGGSSYRWNSIYGGAGVFANSLTIGGNTAVTRTGVGNTGYVPVFSSNDNLVQSRIFQSSTGTYIHNSDTTTPLQITKSGSTFVKFIGESVINASQVEFPPGTESKPGLNFGRRNGTNANDNNTGIYSSAGDHVDIATGGSRRIGWDSAGTSLYTLSAATTDTDKFLVSDSGLIKYRTGSQIRSDIGAQASGNYETDDGSDDRYVFKVDLGNLANVTRWYKVATVNQGNGGLLMRGSLTNHVESFGSTKFDLTIQGREANASDEIEITGSIDVFDDNTGVYIVKSAVSGSYTTYDVYIECYNYTQAWVELIKTGLTSFDTSGNYVTTSPSGLVELDTSAYGEGSYTIIDSENRFSIRKINANTTQISGNAPSSPVLRIGANNQNQIYMDGSTVTINDNMETEKIFINSIDNNTTSTTALVLNGTEVEKRTLGSAAFAAVGDFAANGHNHDSRYVRSDTGTTPTNRITLGYGVSNLNSVGGGSGVTGFKSTFQASNRPGSGNYATGVEFTYHDTGARTQLAAASSGQNTTPELWVRGEAWGSTPSWGDWYQIYHENHKPTYSELGTMAYSNLTGTPSSLPANGGNSDTVDSLHASSFLRSDTADTGTGIITLSQNNSTTPYPLKVLNVSNANGVGIEFSDNAAGSQRGYIKHFHADSKSYGSGASMIISSSEATTTILADGKLMYAEGIYSKPGSGTGAGTRKDQNWDTAYTHSQSAHAPANAEQNVQSDWNATSGDAFIQNKPSIPAASGKGQNQNYVASSTSSSNRGNYGAGVWAYSGYSTGSNRPFTYDATLQVMPTSGLGFELSTGWHSSDEGKLKIRALRDCCEGWGNYYDVWTSANFQQSTINNWNEAYDNHIVSIAVTGTSTKTITLTQKDGGTISANFTDNSGSAAEQDTLATVTGRGATTTTASTFNTITMNTPIVGSSAKIRFQNNDYIRFDDSANRFHFDVDGGTSNASVQAATFVGALSGTATNADKVDNLHASDFLRSNANDSFTGDELHFPTLDLSISNNNSQNQGNTYFRGSGTHFVLGLNSGNTLYLNYGNSSGQFRAYGNGMHWNDVNIGTPWGSSNDGSGTGLDADYVDGYHATRFFRRIGKASANVGPGWVTVAQNTSGRKAGEIIVTDGDSGDHAYIRIEWLRSYADSHWTVLNTGGNSNRITGVRVLRDGDNTYGNKKLQVYCTVQSTYEVNVYEQGDIDDYSGHSAVTPVVQNSISGYSTHGNSYQNLDTYAFSVDQGIQGLKVRTDSDFSLGSSGKLIWENGYGNPYIQDYYGSININSPVYLGASGIATQDLHANNVKGNNFVDKDNSSYSLTPSSASTGYWQVNTPSGYVRIGPSNTSWSHFNTDRAAYYFNKKIIADSGVFGSYDEDVQLIRANSTNDRILIRNTSIGFFLDGAEDMRLENDGDLHVERDVIAYSSTISDERLKDNVLTIDGALDKVCKLRGVEYTWNKGSRKDTRDLGVIAQEVEQVIPEIVREKKMPLIDDSEETYKTVDYEKLTAVLIEAVKELKAEVADLKQQINEK